MVISVAGKLTATALRILFPLFLLRPAAQQSQNPNFVFETQTTAFRSRAHHCTTSPNGISMGHSTPRPTTSSAGSPLRTRHLKMLISVPILQNPPSPAEFPATALQPNMSTYQQAQDPIIQKCPCARCSAVQQTQAGSPTWNPIEQQDPRQFGVSSHSAISSYSSCALSEEGRYSVSEPGSRRWQWR